MHSVSKSTITSLKDKHERLLAVDFDQWPNELAFLFEYLQLNTEISYVLRQAIVQHNLTDSKLSEIEQGLNNGDRMSFKTHIHQAAFCYQFLKYFTNKYDNYQLYNYSLFVREEPLGYLMENYISPIINYIVENLIEHNSFLYLLEKYKKRVEWFTRKDLFSKYTAADKNYEHILDEDLRLFLLDNGIEYPFSQPRTGSGEADIVANISTDDPLVCEVKIFDRSKQYGKSRISDGFSQIVSYANDYQKNIGYLVIFNMDNASLHFNLPNQEYGNSPFIRFDSKVFYLVVINCHYIGTASTKTKVDIIEVSEEEIIRSNPTVDSR